VHVLQEISRGFIQRKDVTVMAQYLPAGVVKEEVVLTLKLSPTQERLTKEVMKTK